MNPKITIGWLLIILSIVLFWAGVVKCFADEIPDDLAVRAIIGEAEGEPYQGKVAVAEVIRRRGSLKGVYGLKAPRVVKKLYSQKTYDECARAWDESVNTNYSQSATHWEGTAFPSPYWAKNMIVTVTIGGQRFYKERK